MASIARYLRVPWQMTGAGCGIGVADVAVVVVV
jgi:hypothetical protein